MTPVQFKGNWSFSALATYEQCPYRFKLAKIDREKELPPKPNNPLERGNRIHKHLEKAVTDGIALEGCEAKSIEVFKPLFTHLHQLYNAGFVAVEENWWFDRDWEVCDRDDVWLWSKLDANVMHKDAGLSIVIDHKSGGSVYKSVEHAQQMQLYAAATALRQSWAETIEVELWYVDEGHIKSMTFSREQALVYVGKYNMRAARIYADRHFRPNPTAHTCKWCPYGPRNGTGVCPVGV
jgi:RecB family exonuclease